MHSFPPISKTSSLQQQDSQVTHDISALTILSCTTAIVPRSGITRLICGDGGYERLASWFF